METKTVISGKEIAAEFIKAKLKKDKIEEELSQANLDLEIKKARLVEYLEERNATRTERYSDILPNLEVSVTLCKPKTVATCPKEFQENLFEFLKTNGREDLIKETVNPQSLASYVNELIEANEAIPEFIDLRFLDQPRINKK